MIRLKVICDKLQFTLGHFGRGFFIMRETKGYYDEPLIPLLTSLLMLPKVTSQQFDFSCALVAPLSKLVVVDFYLFVSKDISAPVPDIE